MTESIVLNKHGVPHLSHVLAADDKAIALLALADSDSLLRAPNGTASDEVSEIDN